MEKVFINIRNSIQPKGEAADKIEFATEGTLVETPLGFELSYDEPLGAELGSSKTSLVVSRKLVTMHRIGEVESRMTFEKDVWHSSEYHTPYGVFDMKVRGLDVIALMDSDFNGKILLRYELAINQLIESYNEMTIIFKKQINN